VLLFYRQMLIKNGVLPSQLHREPSRVFIKVLGASPNDKTVFIDQVKGW